MIDAYELVAVDIHLHPVVVIAYYVTLVCMTRFSKDITSTECGCFRLIHCNAIDMQ